MRQNQDAWSASGRQPGEPLGQRPSQGGGGPIGTTQSLSARASAQASERIAAAILPLVLIAPAMWNGYPLLQWDTGGYLARWYEGYLVPSRSTVFGLYLHLGETSFFWLNLVAQALATLWIIQLTLRVLGLAQRFRLAMITLLLALTTALPWLVSLLLTDIFAGLSVLSLFLLVVHGDRVSRIERIALILFTAFAAATHSATLGVLFGLCCLALVVRPWLRDRISLAGTIHGVLSLLIGAAMLLMANFALSGRLAWTPGGVGVVFGRMLQDGIVAQYLRDHCPQQPLKLCPYRDELPDTADKFLWGKSMFDKLGRFQGLNDEMSFIASRALMEYPGWQLRAAAAATVRQLVRVGTGEGTNGWIPHTYGIIERYIPAQLALMRAAHQQHWQIDFGWINRLHVPIALLSILGVAVLALAAMARRRLDDVALLAAAVTTALLGNALICGIISGPHDRYGARLAWIATLTLLIAASRRFTGLAEEDDASLAA